MDENIPQDPEYPALETEESEVVGNSNKKKIISLVIGVVIVVFILLLVIVLIFILPKFSQKKNEKVELSYWGAWENPAVISEVIQDFTKEHPNIKIKYENQDIKALGKYIDRISAQTPDIYRYHNSWVTQLLGRGLLAPFPQDVVKTSELETQYYDVIKKDLKIKGAYYGIPLGIDTLALFVNTKLFQAAGLMPQSMLWEDLFREQSPYLPMTVRDGTTGKISTSTIALGRVDNIAHATDIVSLLLVQSGVSPEKPVGQNTQRALSFYTTFARSDTKVWDETLDNSKLAFAKGNLAMFFGYSWDIFEIKAINPNLEFTIVPVPYVPGNKKTIASYWVEGVSSKTKHQKEAFEFLKFLTKRETLEKMYAKESKLRLFGELYPRMDMADLLKDNALVYPFVQQAKNAESTIFSSDTYDDADIAVLNGYLGDAVTSVLNGSNSPDTAVAKLNDGVNSVFVKYGK